MAIFVFLLFRLVHFLSSSSFFFAGASSKVLIQYICCGDLYVIIVFCAFDPFEYHMDLCNESYSSVSRAIFVFLLFHLVLFSFFFPFFFVFLYVHGLKLPHSLNSTGKWAFGCRSVLYPGRLGSLPLMCGVDAVCVYLYFYINPM